jgi:hypothetical protein
MKTNAASEHGPVLLEDRALADLSAVRAGRPGPAVAGPGAAVAGSPQGRPGGGWVWGTVRYSGLLGGWLAVLLATGCSDFTMTNPPRTVTEQLLLSTAADQALRTVSLDMFRGKKVCVDGAYFDSYDSKYVLGAIRDAFSEAGALLVNDVPNSDLIVEARSGGYSVDYSSSLIGIPNLGLPIPLAGTLTIPELAFYKTGKQDSVAKFALLAYDTKSREHFYSSGPMVGKAYNYNHKCLGFLWVRTDIPEKQKKKQD